MTITQCRGSIDDLVEGARDEIAELHLEHRAHAEDGRADAGADNQGLGDRRIDHAILAKRIEQALGDFEGAAQFGHVFAHDKNIFIAPHLFMQRLIDRGQIGYFHD